MTRITRAVIPAAGLGTRFLPMTRSMPKEMLPVGRKPVIQYVIEEAVAALDVVAEDAVGSGATGVSVQPTIASARHAATRADTDRIAPV